MMDNQCANIFFTHATIYGLHSVKFAFIERKNIFLHVYPQLSFYVWFVCLYFPHLQNFPQNLFCFSYFYRGRSLFLTFVLHRGVVSVSYRVELFCVPCFLYFLLLCCVYFLSTFWLGSLCQYVTKMVRNSWYV